MIYIPILIIIIILGFDLYFTYSYRFEKTSNDENFDNENDDEETIFDEPNPWNKIQYFTHINKYYIEINKLNEHIEKIMLWKSLPIIKNDLLDVDIENNYLILKTHSEEEALVICNLIINHINNNLTINDIISKNLINYSINKAKRFKLIGTKLTELIKEGLLELNDNNTKNLSLDYTDTDESDLKSDLKSENDKRKKRKEDLINKIKSDPIEQIKNNNVKELFDKINPYEGAEYASINF